MTHEHKILRCEKCRITISQCRCWSPSKTVSWTLCDKCSENPKVDTKKLPEGTPDVIYVKSENFIRNQLGVKCGIWKDHVSGAWEVDGPGQWVAYVPCKEKSWLEEVSDESSSHNP